MMALYRLRLIARYLASSVVDDDMSLSWGVEAASPPSPAALQAAWVAARNIPASSTSWAVLFNSGWGTRAWEVRAAAGGPVLAYDDVARVAGNATPAPSQLTIPMQALVQAGARTRLAGRFNLGPLPTGAMAARPTAAYRGYALTFAQTWHNQLVALGCTPVVLENAGTVGRPIVGYSCPDSFGVMQTRKSEVTLRQTLMI